MYVSFIRCTDIVFPTCKLEYTFPNRTFYRCIAIDVDNVLEEFEDVLLFLFFESVCGVSMRHRHAETATAISVINIKWRPRKLSSLFSDKIKYDEKYRCSNYSNFSACLFSNWFMFFSHTDCNHIIFSCVEHSSAVKTEWQWLRQMCEISKRWEIMLYISLNKNVFQIFKVRFK